MAELDIPFDPETGLRVSRTIIFGPTGSGKTVLAAALAKMYAPRDPEMVYILSPVPTLANLLPEYRWYKIDPSDQQAVDGFFRHIKEKKCLVVIDEFDSYVGGSARSYGSKDMFAAIDYGRNFGCSLICCAHGTSDAPKNLIANSNLVLFFRTTEVGLLKYADKYLTEVPNASETLQSLGPHQALAYQPLAQDKFLGIIRYNQETDEIEVLPREAIWGNNESTSAPEPENPTTPDPSERSSTREERPMPGGIAPPPVAEK